MSFGREVLKSGAKYGAQQSYSAAKWYAGVGNQFDRAVLTPAVRKGMGKFGGIAKAMPSGFNELALTAGLSVFMANQTYDVTKHDSKLVHIGKNFAASSFDSLAFGINPLLGVGLMAANFMGLPTPGDGVMHVMDAIGKSADFNKYGRKTVSQNERTMRATSSNLALLGQGGSHTALGNEAMIMHN